MLSDVAPFPHMRCALHTRCSAHLAERVLCACKGGSNKEEPSLMVMGRCVGLAGSPGGLPGSSGQAGGNAGWRGAGELRSQPSPRAQRQPMLPEAMRMLSALPESVRGCLLEAARLCGPGAAGPAQENVLQSWVAQVLACCCRPTAAALFVWMDIPKKLPPQRRQSMLRPLEREALAEAA